MPRISEKKPTKKTKNGAATTTRIPALRLSVELLEQVEQAAKDAGMTTADFRRYALRQVIDRNSLLAEVQQMEERMARQQVRLQKRMTQMHSALQFQFAVIEQFMKMVLTLAPDLIDDEARAAAQVTGRNRYKSLMDSIPAALDSALAKIFAEKLEGSDD